MESDSNLQPEAMEEDVPTGNVEDLTQVDKLTIQINELQKRLEMEEERHTCKNCFTLYIFFVNAFGVVLSIFCSDCITGKICYEREINCVIVGCWHRCACMYGFFKGVNLACKNIWLGLLWLFYSRARSQGK